MHVFIGVVGNLGRLSQNLSKILGSVPMNEEKVNA